MSAMEWEGIQNGLKSRQVGTAPGGDGEFWREFRSRAGQIPQVSPPAIPPAISRWAAGSACVIFVCVLAGWSLLGRTGEPALSRFKSVDVKMPHSAVLIMSDKSSQSTVLWVIGSAGDGGK